MSFLGKIFSGGTKDVLQEAGSIVDNLVTSQEERGELKNKFTALIQNYELAIQDQLTERQRIDMNSDSWLPKNIRPLSLAFTTIMVTVMAFTDGNVGGFTVDKGYIALMNGLLTLQYGFYFGSRAIEKVTDTIGKYDLRRRKRRQKSNQ